MSLRSSATLNPETKSYLEESIKLCKEAIELDVNDSDSWQGLGTTFLKLYFDFSHDVKDLSRSLAAYNKASSYSHDPDIYRNRGVIYYYMENYDDAISDFKRAIEYDSLKYKELCEKDIDEILKYAKSTNESLEQLVRR